MSLENTGLEVQHAGELRRALEQLFEVRYDLFYSLFWEGRAVAREQFPIEVRDPLIRSGLCSEADGSIAGGFRVIRHGGLFIVADTLHYVGNDRVWYPLPDESLLFAGLLPDCTGERVLDIGCGSGILALTAIANGAKAVTAIDVAPRAITLTRFNAALNGLSGLETQLADLENLSCDQPFDRILINPPFVLLPPGTVYMLSGDGGPDGLSLMHTLFHKLDKLSHRNTAVSTISMSPGDEYMSALERLFLARMRNQPRKILVTDVYGSVAPIELALEPFRAESNFAPWTAWLAERGYSHLHYLMIDAFRADRFSYERRNLVPRL